MLCAVLVRHGACSKQAAQPAAPGPTRTGAPRRVTKHLRAGAHGGAGHFGCHCLVALTGRHHRHFCTLRETKRKATLPIFLRISSSHPSAMIFQSVCSECGKEFTNWCANETKAARLVLFLMEQHFGSYSPGASSRHLSLRCCDRHLYLDRVFMEAYASQYSGFVKRIHLCFDTPPTPLLSFILSCVSFLFLRALVF